MLPLALDHSGTPYRLLRSDSGALFCQLSTIPDSVRSYRVVASVKEPRAASLRLVVIELITKARCLGIQCLSHPSITPRPPVTGVPAINERSVDDSVESRNGTIIRVWHPPGRVPNSLCKHRTSALWSTRFLRWHGPLVRTAPLTSSIVAGWTIPVSLPKKRLSGGGKWRFIRTTSRACWRYSGKLWDSDGHSTSKVAFAAATANFAGF